MKKEVQREVKKKVKEEITEVAKAQIMKMMPKATNPDAKVKPVHYWGGVIYTAVKMKKFRALKVRGDNYSECSRQWGGGSRTQKEAWADCVRATEARHKPKASKAAASSVKAVMKVKKKLANK